MRALVRTLLLALLLAAINGSEIEPQLFDKGHFVEITVVTIPSTASECYLVTPSNNEIDLTSELLPDKYEYLPNVISTCRVKINDLDENDEGLWSLHAVIPTEDETGYELKEQVYVSIKSDEPHDIGNSKETASEENSTATSEESSEEDKKDSSESSLATSGEFSTVSSSEEDEAVEIWLSDLRFITRTGLNVDINLPKTQSSETCTLTTPDGTTVEDGEGIAGVTAHSSSDYVSCRVVVGPMDDSLLGKWTLCGTYEENGEKHRRCQNAEIARRNSANPDSTWHTTINARFNHVVHFGGTMTPAVRGSGSVVSCHVVTPDGEDLFVTRDRQYPDVQLIQDTDSICSIAIGPIAESHLGDWDVYGTFDSSLFGYNEVRNPINMELYDKDNPYDQAYNVTTLNPIQHVINLGSTISVETTSTGEVDVCQFTMPSGQSYVSTDSLPVGVSFVSDNRVACRLSVGPITYDMLGQWLLIGKFSNRGVHTENRLTFTIIKEDPSNPIEDDRPIQYLGEQFFDTSIGASLRVTIPHGFITTSETCHIRTPQGLQYTIMEGFHIPGVEVVTGSNIICGVSIEVSEDLIGNWTLISREISSFDPNERRLPFIIYVEETVEAVPKEITITEGNAIHVRLANPTELYDTCLLKDPNDEEFSDARLDNNQMDTCGFLASSVDVGHSGTWNIVYGTKIIYKAPITVNVNAKEDPDTIYLNWVEHASVNETIGPEEAVYCKVQSPVGDVVFDGFGRCQVVVTSVMRDEHQGDWSIVVGLPGRIVTEKHMLKVIVIEADAKPKVDAKLVGSEEILELSCSVTSSQQKSGCLFRSPGGEVLVANQGVSEGRYVFHVNQNGIEDYSCSLQITEPMTTDIGIWRCDIESEEENFYGFLTVTKWAVNLSIITESAVTEPELVTRAAMLSVEENEPVTLECSARASLRYCYFRSPNGSIFNVGPGMSYSTWEYVGAGLDAGECGVRFQSLLYSDAGQWSCHAAIDGQEQSQSIYVSVREEISVSSALQAAGFVIQVQVPENRQIEYCRFVRFDGFGFSSDNRLPVPYHLEMNSTSSVGMAVSHRSDVDLLPWTVVAKLVGRDGEISRVTTVDIPAIQPTPSYYSPLFLWLPLLLILTGCLMVGAALAPSTNRRWAAERASRLRTSMRDGMRAGVHRFSSFRKKPITDTNPAA